MEYHGTSSDHLESIQREGLRSSLWWDDEEIEWWLGAGAWELLFVGTTPGESLDYGDMLIRFDADAISTAIGIPWDQIGDRGMAFYAPEPFVIPPGMIEVQHEGEWIPLAETMVGA